MKERLKSLHSLPATPLRQQQSLSLLLGGVPCF